MRFIVLELNLSTNLYSLSINLLWKINKQLQILKY